MKNLENEKFTLQAMMAYDQRQVTYAVQHSRHICTRNRASNEAAPPSQMAAKEIASYSQNDSVRVWRA